MKNIPQHQKIMVVEEEQNIASSTKLTLEANHFTAEIFTDPSLALAEFKKGSGDYNLIILDMKMLHMSAFNFMKEIKIKKPDIKILLITTFEVNPLEFNSILPTVKIEGLVEKQYLADKIIPSINKILGLSN
ncbi:MAG: response regulator [Nitrosotalea sp.]